MADFVNCFFEQNVVCADKLQDDGFPWTDDAGNGCVTWRETGLDLEGHCDDATSSGTAREHCCGVCEGGISPTYDISFTMPDKDTVTPECEAFTWLDWWYINLDLNVSYNGSEA